MISLLPDGAMNYRYVQVPYEKNNSKHSCDLISDIISEINKSIQN